MISGQLNDRDFAMNPAEKGPPRIPSGTLPLLTTRCLGTALALQALGVLTPALSPLLFPGLLLAVIGLGAYACSRSGRIENGWAFLGLAPFVGLLLGYTVLSFRPAQPNAALHAVRGAAHAVLVGLLLVGAGALGWVLTQRGHELHGPVPDYFPILAVVPGNDSTFTAHIVPNRDRDAFVQAHPNLSYLVPQDLETVLHANLEYNSRDLLQTGYFELTQISANRQAFKVRYPIHEEAYSVGWYEATPEGIEPKRYLFFHEMTFSFFILPVLALAALVNALLTSLLNHVVWPRFVSADD